MLTAELTVDGSTIGRPALARSAQDAGRRTSTHDLVDEFTDLTHAAEAAARRRTPADRYDDARPVRLTATAGVALVGELPDGAHRSGLRLVQDAQG